ncbi:MD-2-related lipid-recognition protein ROSY1 [Arabidopsis thaliana]|uniref:MD-2-related lipid-recognition domain-containing protein n=2 Tax=Arabidopsis TaxID=3701 RepID=A0A178VTK1_ARATH|nr:MD-2-related lipid-recognition domain [Arabidopsis thaliana x Arabidopsis arenosa]OAP08192.1 hypothetical protein AXX17_AT2G11100 [Arabidopsis thaliana]
MAISHTQLLLLLLVSLFFSPALCGPKFQTCETGKEYPLKVSSVEISPDPVKRSGNGEITITGVTNKEISDGVTVNLKLAVGMFPVSTKSYSLCDITACPVAPGPIVLTLPNIFTPREKRTAIGYTIIISITDKPLKESMMCILFVVKLTGHASMINQVTE